MGGRGSSSPAASSQSRVVPVMDATGQPAFFRMEAGQEQPAGRMTRKQVEERYKGKKYGTHAMDGTISAIAYDRGRAILLSGSYDPNGGGYRVEAAIDMSSGRELLNGRWRYADTKDDAIDVVGELLDRG